VGRIPEETIEAIRSRVDLVELVGRSVSLRAAGRSFKGLCPFHDEKTPSFHVNPQLGIFHCFGCNAGGNAFAFLMRHDNLTFPEAVRVLARECGIEVPEATDAKESGLGQRLRAACAAADRFYRAALRGAEGASARAYLERRGIDAETAERFGIGFAPDRWDGLVRGLGEARVPADLAARAGLLGERPRGGHYDRLRGRVVFAIRDVRGDPVAFGGRILPPAPGQAPVAERDSEPKYLNTPESPLFRKREAFYGLPDALEAIRRAGRAVVVEGYFDRIALVRAGLGEALATCGTALTEDHARQLRRRTGEVVLLFDGDEAGQRAVERSLALLLPEGLRVRAAELPPGEDPDTYLEQRGVDALRDLVNGAGPALEAVTRRAVARGCSTPWEKADAVAAVTPLLVLVSDPVERGESARQLAFATGVPAEEVEAALRRERLRRRGLSDDFAEGGSPEAVGGAVARRADEGLEARTARRLARLLLDHPRLATLPDLAALPELADRVPPPWDRALPALVDALSRRGPVDVAELAEALGGEAGPALLQVAVEGAPDLDAGEARRAIGDTILRLRQRRRAEERRATTRRYREGAFDSPEDFLAEKQRQVEERRRAQGLVSGPVPAEDAPAAAREPQIRP
jgi:DNA primase